MAHAGGVSPEAEWALHRRAWMACDAAVSAGVPGRFRVWERAGVFAVLATEPALGFLSTVTGVVPATVQAAVDVVDGGGWCGVRPRVVVPTDVGERLLTRAGFVRVGDRVLAVRRLDPAAPGDGVVDADDSFLDVLLAGYEVDGAVAAFIRAEHGHPLVRRFQVLAEGAPVAAAAMTVHGEVAVFGGASTVPAWRGRGAQSRLLRHRLHVAANVGCRLAVATARAGSVSADNLRRAGFLVRRQAVWAR